MFFLSRLREIIPLRLRSLFRSRAADAELDEELRYHLDMQTAEFMRQGFSNEQAAQRARRQLGNLTLHREYCRDARKLSWFDGILQDFRLGARGLLRYKGFTLVSALTLALGIGGTTAFFSVFDVAVLHSVVAPNPDELVLLQEFGSDRSESGGNPARLADWQNMRSLAALGGFYEEGGVLVRPEGPVRLAVLRAFGDLAGTLRPALQLGRMMNVQETRGKGAPVAILSAKGYRDFFHSDSAIQGETIRLSGVAYQVIGVMADALRFPSDVDVWVSPGEIQTSPRNSGFLTQVGRLRPQTSIQNAQAELTLLCSRLASEYPDTDKGRSARLISLQESVSNVSRRPLVTLLAAVACILVIGCLNISGLLLVRTLGRRREAAIRASVGAGYFRLVRLFFAESLLLASFGGFLGLAVSQALLRIFKSLLPAELPNLADAAINGSALLCSLGLSVLAALIFGVVPAWQFAMAAQAPVLKEGGAGSVGENKHWMRGVLVIVQVAFSVMLLVTAGLLLTSFLNVRNQTLGYNPERAYSFTLNLPWDSDPRQINTLAEQVVDRLSSMPGLRAVGVVDRVPLQGGSQTRYLLVRGKTLSAELSTAEFGWRTASAGYFKAAGIPLIAGNIFRDWQAGHGPHEVLISESLAGRLFPGEDAVGREIAENPRSPGAAPKTWRRIVGVVGAVPLRALDASPAAEVYTPWGSTYWPMMSFVVRTERPVADLTRFVRNNLRTLAPDQIFGAVEALSDLNAEARSTPRRLASLTGCFAAVALGLAAIGIFGLLSQETVSHTQEIGVRLALGAEPRSIGINSLKRGLRLVGLGIVLGLTGAWFASELIASLLFGVQTHDAVSYGAAALILLVAAVIASLGPALRAARIDPIRALRHE